MILVASSFVDYDGYDGGGLVAIASHRFERKRKTRPLATPDLIV
jgi:hypothetical protein